MRICIVGGCGFIGTHTVDELIKHGHDVVVIDVQHQSKLKLTNTTRAEYRYGSVTDYQSLLNAMSDESGFDAVLMLAAISDSSQNLRTPSLAIDINIKGVVNVLEAMSVLNIPRIIFSSTVWVYSVAPQECVDEDTDLCITSSDHIYTTCKLTCEAIIRNYSVMKNIKYTILRYGIAYGPECHPMTVIASFIKKSLNGEDLTITGNGSIYRNFLYVTDHARGNRLAIESTDCDNTIVNLEGPEKVTLNRVAECVQQLSNSNIAIQYTDKRIGDYVGKIVDSSRAKKLINWEPQVSFNTGIENTYNYYNTQI